MRTTIELPDELLTQARLVASVEGISLKEFFIEAVRYRVSPPKQKVRRLPTPIGDPSAPPMAPLTREQIDEAMFG
ncbi:MAG: hypothetical protein NTV70_00850 [Acidobacteria bacterium]|nr:hypothetical protein [Acidobacteriota bacterium]